MDAKPDKRWYLVQCKPRQDFRALEHLQSQDYNCVLPKHRVEYLRKGQWQVQEEPLFPGYLFIELDTLHDNWMPIRSTRGVSHIVRFGTKPLAVPERVVERLRHIDKASESSIQEGDKVQILWGDEHWLEAIFLARDGTDRVLLLLKLLQQEFQISVPTRAITKAS
ncbi:transcription/translation regulatory transformer protein RfaH [Pseudomonas sp. BGr12]|uniref:transcription/translation regulatory transformer protein RfaH n=1 Tax=unclassified Pseudomonas TaxID=196821 RepID=UPI001785F727|nr:MULTISPECIES: transcription/translation regulatory transformer protein RfaH [unclassified Pseudomonas]MBD9503582.1 transcription/translation regulatory transformer protein RfaH [Pseudomonas sp. PDM17]MDL2425526.1 transcription/translation regulatory transformer protein RfaH [Pseudomonas sp. BJa5]